MADMQEQASQLSSVELEGNDFASLLHKEFKPKTEEAKSAVEQAVQTLAQQALAGTAVIGQDVVKICFPGAGEFPVVADAIVRVKGGTVAGVDRY